MGKKIEVIVIDSQTLELKEDAKQGDIIDLREINEVDMSIIIDKINKKTDDVYEQKLNEARKELAKDYELKLRDEIEKIKFENTTLKNKLLEQEQEITKNLKNKYEIELINLSNEIKNKEKEIKDIENRLNLETENKLTKIEIEYKEKLSNQKNILTTEVLNLENEIKRIQENHHFKEELNKTKLKETYDIELEKLKEEIRKKDTEISHLENQRSSLNVKIIGESLEKWCDNEMQTYLLHSSDNIVWKKDNEVVKGPAGTKGTKADYIYKVYATSEKKEEDLLTSAILEMKSEDPTAPTKQTNASFYKKLHEDRVKKNIEYAILVSQLEWDSENDIPIRKVNEYEKMYVVRPAYFTILLNIITAFGLKYKEIILKTNEEQLEFKDLQEIIDEFEEMKDDILNKSIRYIQDRLSDIEKQTEHIQKANDNIKEATRIILETHLKTIINKIENFNINRITAKIEKL